MVAHDVRNLPERGFQVLPSSCASTASKKITIGSKTCRHPRGRQALLERRRGDLVDQLGSRFAVAAKEQPHPEVHIRADRPTHYENVTRVMALAAKNGIVRMASSAILLSSFPVMSGRQADALLVAAEDLHNGSARV